MLQRICLSAASFLALVPLAHAQSGGELIPQPAAQSTVPQHAISGSWNPCECTVEKQGPWYQVWGSFGYAYWWMKDAPIATPLATTGSGFNAGALGDPNTVILFGDQPLDFGGFNGLRFDGGVWLNTNHTFGLGFGVTAFNSRTVNTNIDGTNIDLYRPIYDAQAFQQVGLIVSDATQQITGSLAIENTARFYGFDIHGRQNILNNETFTLDGILGYRFFRLSESLSIRQRSQYLGDGDSPLIIGQYMYSRDPISMMIVQSEPMFTSVNSLVIQDTFSTRNQIHGVQLGARGEGRWGALYASFAGKVTLGVNQQRVDVSGSTRDGDNIVSASGGILAVSGYSPTLDANGNLVSVGTQGSQSYNQFVVMPEVGMQLGMQVTSHARIFVGYDWLYINDVMRPGNQIDPVINQRYVPSSPAYGTLAGPDAPNVTRSRNDFVAHGFSFGFELQY